MINLWLRITYANILNITDINRDSRSKCFVTKLEKKESTKRTFLQFTIESQQFLIFTSASKDATCGKVRCTFCGNITQASFDHDVTLSENEITTIYHLTIIRNSVPISVVLPTQLNRLVTYIYIVRFFLLS